MKTANGINLYSFNELNKDSKQNALSQLSDINTDSNWWEFIFNDAKEVGLQLEEFDFDSASFVRDLSGHFIMSAHEVAANIIRDHGQDCDTHKTAQSFLDEVNETQGEFEEMEGRDYEDAMMEIEEKFCNDLLIDYKNMLQKDFEERESNKMIVETIEANDYLFFADGELAHCTTYVGNHPKAGITEFHFHGQTFLVR